MKALKFTALTFGLMLSGQVIAQEPEKPKDPAKMFEHLDTNKDGSIDKTEFNAAAEKREAKKEKEIDADKHFTKLDSNSDGLISKEEFLAHKEDMKAKKENKKTDK